MIKYNCYQLFLSALKEKTKVYVYGNGEYGKEITSALKLYKPSALCFNESGAKKNLLLTYHPWENGVRTHKKGNDLYLLFGSGINCKDIVYMLLSAYYSAERSFKGCHKGTESMAAEIIL